MSKLVIRNCKLFDGEKIQNNKAVLVNGKIIENIIDDNDLPENCNYYDANNMIVAPSFIDLQVNGGGGVLFTETPTTESLNTMVKAHEQFGTLNILPTLISTDLDTIKKAIDAIKDFGEDSGVLGLHLEGPFIYSPKGGIHSKEYIHSCTLSEIKSIYENAENCIKIITYAPEAIDKECLSFIRSKNTYLFVGHSNASYTETIKSFENGACGVTHLYNAMSQLNSREPGIVGASFLSEHTWAGIIADGFHVDFNSIIIAKKMKGDKLFLVTDAMPPVGVGDLEFSIGQNNIKCIDGKCLSESGTIAGSALNMNKALQNIVFKCNINLEEALKMTSTYQAEMLGISDKYGYIRKNCYADLVILDDELKTYGIVRQGKVRVL